MGESKREIIGNYEFLIGVDPEGELMGFFGESIFTLIPEAINKAEPPTYKVSLV